LSLAKLLATVRKALESKPLPTTPEPGKRLSAVMELLGNSPAMQLLRNSANQAAKSNSPVMITGESGSGREMLAHHIHQSSGVAGPLVTLDHGRAGADDARAYLFGSMEGAKYTEGLFDKASNGTLFIPRLQKLPTDVQELLDNAFESGAFTPKGSSESRPVDFRVICSTTDDLDRLVNEGRLYGPLYYHLNVLPLKVPALRDRPEDIPDLVRYFADWFPNNEDLPYRQFSVSVQNRMRNHDWPGNIQELRNLIQRLLVLGGEDEVTMPELEEALGDAVPNRDTATHEKLFELPLREAREEFERDYLVYRLKKVGGSVGKLSESVGMERTHLYRKLRSLGIDPKSVGNT
jgi:DNA-binding NtrC family response regulator